MAIKNVNFRFDIKDLKKTFEITNEDVIIDDTGKEYEVMQVWSNVGDEGWMHTIKTHDNSMAVTLTEEGIFDKFLEDEEQDYMPDNDGDVYA